MTRYTLTVPLEDNDGQPIPDVHEYVRGLLAADFPAWTEVDGSGHWVGPAHIPYLEPVRVYIIDAGGANDHDELRAIATYVRRAARQDAVYLTRQPIETELI